MMENEKTNLKQRSDEPVLDFISGNTDTLAAKRLTKNIRSLRSLWLLSKMSGCNRK